jgi:hypothetical protein
MRGRRRLGPWLALLLLLSGRAEAREGTLAVVALGTGAGNAHEVVLRLADALKDSLGGLARQASVTAYLVGQPNAGALPAGDAGQEITVLVDRVRGRQASSGEIASLGRLLGVDYLLLVTVRGRGYACRLFSVHRLTYAPETLESSLGDPGTVRDYLRAQTRPARPTARSWLKRWWVAGLVAVVGGVTLGLALANRDQSSGDLRIRVSR